MVCDAPFLVYTVTLWHTFNMLTPTSALEIPNPRRDYKLCGGDTKRPKWVCDPERMLHNDDVAKINRLIEDIRYNTTCACDNQSECPSDGAGFTVSMVMVSSLPKRSGTATNYANYLRRHEWIFGACDDDTVVVITSVKQEIGLAYGSTTIKKLKLDVVEDILRNSKKVFREGDVTSAAVYILTSLKQAFCGKYRRTPPFPVWTVVHMALGSFFVLFCFLSMYICKILYSQ